MVNTQLSSDADAKSGWYMVNIGFNGKEVMKAGPSDSKYPSSYARRDLLDQRIASNQKIVGVYGWTRLADGMLRSVGLILADGQ